MAAKKPKQDSDVSNWVGWVYFAGIMMVILGVLQMIAGITALFNDSFYAVSENFIVTVDFTQWGWVHLVLGLLIAAAGVAVSAGATWGRVVAVLLAASNVIVLFGFVWAYPVWVLIMLTVNILVIYALVVHGDEARVE